MPEVLAFRHVPFEDLGAWGAVLARISHRFRCIGALFLRKFFCNQRLNPAAEEFPDADRV